MGTLTFQHRSRRRLTNLNYLHSDAQKTHHHGGGVLIIGWLTSFKLCTVLWVATFNKLNRDLPGYQIHIFIKRFSEHVMAGRTICYLSFGMFGLLTDNQISPDTFKIFVQCDLTGLDYNCCIRRTIIGVVWQSTICESQISLWSGANF